MSYIYGAPIHDVSRSHTTTHHSRQDSSGRVISSSQRPLPDNTRHSQQTDIHALRWDSNPRSQQVRGQRPLTCSPAPRPEESYQLWCVVVCDLETSRIGAPYIYDISSLKVKQLLEMCVILFDAHLTMFICRINNGGTVFLSFIFSNSSSVLICGYPKFPGFWTGGGGRETLFQIMPYTAKSHDRGVGAVNCTTPSDPHRKLVLEEISIML